MSRGAEPWGRSRKSISALLNIGSMFQTQTSKRRMLVLSKVDFYHRNSAVGGCRFELTWTHDAKVSVPLQACHDATRAYPSFTQLGGGKCSTSFFWSLHNLGFLSKFGQCFSQCQSFLNSLSLNSLMCLALSLAASIL